MTTMFIALGCVLSACLSLLCWNALLRAHPWRSLLEYAFITLSPATGHKGAVLELHWTTDGERIASASPDKSVRVWDAATGAQVRRPERLGCGGPHTCVCKQLLTDSRALWTVLVAHIGFARSWPVPDGCSDCVGACARSCSPSTKRLCVGMCGSSSDSL